MFPQPVIKNISSKKLIGTHLQTSYNNDRTKELWQKAMPLFKRLQGIKTTELYSLQVYPTNYFKSFNPTALFTKWALVPLENKIPIVEGLQNFEISESLYAMFHYKGLAADKSIYAYIFKEWLPGSDYELDDRPHFEILGENYSNTSPESEEDIFIPIRPGIPAR